MPYIGGKWTVVGESKGLGSKINVVSRERATAIGSTRGILAVPLELNWGTDEAIKSFTTDDWTKDALYKFGYNTDAPEMRNIREMFLGGANELLVARLNAKGDKASNSICTAKYPGTRGNDLEISIEADVDAGIIENELSKIGVRFTATGNTVTATYSNLPDGYGLVGSVEKDGVKETTVTSKADGNKLVFSFPATVEAGSYDVKASVKDGQVITLISTGAVTVTINPETHRTVKLTKGEETPGETVETATVAFEVGADTVKATISNKPEGYDARYTIKNNSDVVIAEIPGRIWVDNEGDVYTLHLTPDAGDQNLKFEIALIKQQKGAKKQVIGTVAFTSAVEGEDKEAEAVAKYTSATPETFEPEIPAKYIVKTFLDGVEIDKQKVKNIGFLKDNDFIIWDKSLQLEETAGMPLTGGTNSEITNADYSEALNKLETQVFHILACPIQNEEIQNMFIEYTKRLRDTLGIKFQTVMPLTQENPNYEGIIQVPNEVQDEDANPGDIVYWVAGLQAGCRVQDSCGNVDYTGAYTLDTNYTQRDLEAIIDDGYFGFHLCRGQDRLQHVRTYLDINTLTDFDDGQNEDWTRNQTIRVIDQCCNDIAAIFNNRYAARMPNTDIGRNALRTDIKQYLEALETAGAIENFDPGTISIESVGKTIVTVQVEITPVNAMEQMYMTIFIQ